LLITGTTIGVYLMLSATASAADGLPSLGAILIALGGFGYAGSLILSRAVSDGEAIIVDTAQGFMRVQAVTQPPAMVH
jgi:drug/metabolite transporter (DMT)-like permease